MLYAICENGGTENEVIHAERYERHSQAVEEVLRLASAEEAWEDDENFGYTVDGEPLTRFDVVGVLPDGSITTEI